MSMFRGSRKHILDWLQQPAFPAELSALLQPSEAIIDEDAYWQPKGHADPAEPRLETFGPIAIPGAVSWTEIADWWLVHQAGANTPNWDLLSTCRISDRQGIVLVEAKANCAELKVDGKTLRADASANSRANHEQIGHAIEEARVALQVQIPGIAISRESHYQLSNRVAFAWKLANMGLPTILMYLGFLNDIGIADVGSPLSDAEHWDAVFRRHSNPVLPEIGLERPIDCGPASMQIIVRARAVLEESVGRAV